MFDADYSKVLLRLSAILYVDSTKINNLNQDTVLIKIVESIFVGNNNGELSAHDILSIIKNDYKMNFDEDQILRLISNNTSFNHCNLNKFSDANKKFALLNLKADYYKQLCIDAKPNHFEMIIGELYNQYKDKKGFIGHTRKSVSNIIHKYIYYLFAVNFDYFRTLTDENTKLDNDFLLELSRAKGYLPDKPDEIEIVNAFLSYEDSRKNRVVFDIATLAFEYCITIGSNVQGSLNTIDYLQKHFYLDTNVLFRALGMNGESRRQKILSFLSKCVENGQKLYVTDLTMKEFHETLDYNIHDLSLFSSELDIDVYESSSIGDKEILKHYLRIKKEKQINPNQYRSLILEDFDSIVEKYAVTVADTTELYTPENLKIINSFTDNLFKATEDSNNPKTIKRAKHDVANYFFLKKQNDTSSLTSKDTLYKFITSDSQLISWERNSLNLYKNICLKPTDWLAFLYRYISTTDDDFESFVGFLKLNSHRKSTLDENTIRTIMNAVTHTSLSIDEQKRVIGETLNNELARIKELQESDDQDSISKLIYDEALKLVKEEYSSNMEEAKAKESSLYDAIKARKQAELEIKKELEESKKREHEQSKRNVALENEKVELAYKSRLSKERTEIIKSLLLWTTVSIVFVFISFKYVPTLIRIENKTVGTDMIAPILTIVLSAVFKVPSKLSSTIKRIVEINKILNN